MGCLLKPDDKRVDLVFEGGGVKGIGLAGAFSFLDDHGLEPQRLAGTSPGAITAALVAVGYCGDELKSLVLEKMEFKKFEDGGGWPFRGSTRCWLTRACIRGGTSRAGCGSGWRQMHHDVWTAEEADRW